MEEKERYYYKKILRDCVMPEGLFEIKDREGNFYLIIENKKDVDTITNLLNQQDKRIKELESKLRVSNSLNASLSLEHSELKKRYDSQEKLLSQKLAKNSKLTLENQRIREDLQAKDILVNTYMLVVGTLDNAKQLKHSQKQLAIEEFEKLLSKLSNIENTLINCGNGKEDAICWFVKLINDQIEKLKGEK